MATKLYLTVVTDASSDKDAILHTSQLPLILGDEDENLACGSCKEVIARNCSTRTLHERFSTNPGSRLIAHCTCGADNLLPSGQVTKDKRAS